MQLLPTSGKDQRRVYVMHYPPDCSGSQFQEAVDSSIVKLRRETSPFALVHACRSVKYSTLDLRLPFLHWGKQVLGFGAIERVSFVIGDVGAMGLLTLNGMLSLSPVQPARIFNSIDEAERWSRSDLEST